MTRQLDCLFINPNSAKAVYQSLADNFTAIEVPVWSLLLAQSMRSKGWGVAILDCDAERLDDESAVKKIKDANPRLCCFVVYGQNPNSGTTNMEGAIRLAERLRQEYPEYKICFVGSHTSALPKEVLTYTPVDFVLLNEGVYALDNLLKTDLVNDLGNVRGIGWVVDTGMVSSSNPGHMKFKGNFKIHRLNEPERVVPNHLMDHDLPGYAWDLLPYKYKPLDLYRSHFWHADFNYNYRTPAAALYTSLGCQFKCSFCMINILNRTNNDDNTVASDSNFMRFWSPEFIIKEFDKLAAMGISTIRLSDEMFFLNKKYFEPLLKLLSERDYGPLLRMWAYARVDTVRDHYLKLFRDAGIRWLALGIEAANQKIRKESIKGNYQDVDIREVVRDITNADINVIANYIYGLPEDNFSTMKETLDLSLELNTEMMNCYPCMALPGSPLYIQAKQQGTILPSTFSAWSFLSYDCLPLPTQYLTSAEVLAFRDMAWQTYFTNPNYLNLVEKKFGLTQRNNIEDMTKIKLKRKLLENV